MSEEIEQNVLPCKNNTFLAFSRGKSDTYRMETEAPPPKRGRKKSKNPQPPPPQWAARLHLALLAAGITDDAGNLDKRAVAERFHVTPKAVEHWINGARQPRFEQMVAFADLTGVTIDWLLGRTDVNPLKREYLPASNDQS
jgi:hypothetical protein